jgi:formate/nitrite transporter FocA (FNT family)
MGRRKLQTMRLWAIVLVVNVAGTWLFAMLLDLKPAFSPAVTAALRSVAAPALHHAFGFTFVKAVFAGWLIALMVWILPSTESARLFTIILVTYVVALGGFVHIVAGSTEFAYAVLNGMTSWESYFTAFFFPTLLGNIVGGVALVSMLNHGSIAPEIEGNGKKQA